MDRDLMIQKLQSKLPDKRFQHSIGVEYTAATLSFLYDVDVNKARIAGLLHDCAKYVSNEKKIAKCEKRGIFISEAEYLNPELLHAKLSAVYAKEKYGVFDEEILSAISCHTTGKPNMSTLDKIIYISDFIEPNRVSLPDLEIIRKKAYTNLDQCLVHILDNSMKHLCKKSATIDPLTKQTFEYYQACL